MTVNHFCNASKIYSVYVAFHDRSTSVCGGFTLRLGYAALRHVTVSMAMRARRLHVITRVVVSGRRTVRASVGRKTSADVIVYSRTRLQSLHRKFYSRKQIFSELSPFTLSKRERKNDVASKEIRLVFHIESRQDQRKVLISHFISLGVNVP